MTRDAGVMEQRHADDGRPYLSEHTPQRRLERLQRDARQGQLAGVELELHEWRRDQSFPPAARVMLAGLIARRGQVDDALSLLDAEPEHRDDPAVLELRIALLTMRGNPEKARLAAERLYHEHGDTAEVRHWLTAMEAPGAESLPASTDAEVEHLAGELLERMELIPTLVAGQKIKPDLKSVRLLRDAIRRMARDVGNAMRMLSLCEALAELSLLLGDEDEARRWSHRGLRIDPYYAPLALVLAQIRDDTTVGPPATQVLAAAAEAHPRYRDVLAALIRRQHAQGERDAARQTLQRWSDDEPQHPVVLALHRELAA